MSIEAMKQALEALEENLVWFSTDTMIGKALRKKTESAITAGRQAIAEAEKQEPVAVFDERLGRPVMLSYAPMLEDGQPLYTHPPKTKWVNVECPLCGDMAVAETHPNLPKREWVGLTHDEMPQQYKDDSVFVEGWMWAEGKLKEKNHDI